MFRCFPQALAALLCFGLWTCPLHAETKPLPSPQGAVLLTVSGKIGLSNGVDDKGLPVARFDRAMLDALPSSIIRTTTPWHEAVTQFDGVAPVALMQAVKAEGTIARAIALNEYVVEIPVSDFMQGICVLALKVDGKTMSVREKGPIFVIYAYDQFPRSQRDTLAHKSIWQLSSVEFK